MTEGHGSQDAADNLDLLGWSQTCLNISTFRMWRQRMGSLFGEAPGIAVAGVSKRKQAKTRKRKWCQISRGKGLKRWCQSKGITGRQANLVLRENSGAKEVWVWIRALPPASCWKGYFTFLNLNFCKIKEEYYLLINSCVGGGSGLVAKLYQTLAISWTVAHQAPLSMEFSRQEYWSGLPFPSPGDLPEPGIEPASPALQADSLPLSHQGSPKFLCRLK